MEDNDCIQYLPSLVGQVGLKGWGKKLKCVLNYYILDLHSLNKNILINQCNTLMPTF